MQLESMWVHGMRRFGGDAPTRLRLDAPLVCLIGANEVGKSTLLDALELVQQVPNEETEALPAVPASDWTRGENLPGDRAIVRLRYRLGATTYIFSRNWKPLTALAMCDGSNRQSSWMVRLSRR